MPTDEEELAALAQGRVGTVLHRKYHIDKVLGAGGMAVVYKATHRNDAEFAIKMLHPELSRREDVRVRFLREGKAANSVKHSGVVVVVDDDVAEDGAAFLVMELLSGADVETLWERAGGRLPLSAVLAVGDQLLDVLAAAHDKGNVHRDVKPPNLFVTKDGTLKLLDFGIARVKDVAGGSGSGHQTGTGMLLGTPAFMAPEQAYAKASEIDGQTDVWAVGATLFTLLTGHPVHEGENAAQLMIHAATTRARPLASLAPDVPAAVATVIDRALSFEKASRWPTAAAMQEALRTASAEALGGLPSKGVLASLLAGHELGHAATQAAQIVTPPRVDAAPFPIEIRAPREIVPSGPRLLAAGSTAQPVSSEPLPSLPVQRGLGHLDSVRRLRPLGVVAVILATPFGAASADDGGCAAMKQSILDTQARLSRACAAGSPAYNPQSCATYTASLAQVKTQVSQICSASSGAAGATGVTVPVAGSNAAQLAGIGANTAVGILKALGPSDEDRARQAHLDELAEQNRLKEEKDRIDRENAEREEERERKRALQEFLDSLGVSFSAESAAFESAPRNPTLPAGADFGTAAYHILYPSGPTGAAVMLSGAPSSPTAATSAAAASTGGCPDISAVGGGHYHGSLGGAVPGGASFGLNLGQKGSAPLSYTVFFDYDAVLCPASQDYCPGYCYSNMRVTVENRSTVPVQARVSVSTSVWPSVPEGDDRGLNMLTPAFPEGTWEVGCRVPAGTVAPCGGARSVSIHGQDGDLCAEPSAVSNFGGIAVQAVK